MRNGVVGGDILSIQVSRGKSPVHFEHRKCLVTSSLGGLETIVVESSV